MFTVSIEQIGGSMNQSVNLREATPVKEVLAMKKITDLSKWSITDINGNTLGHDDLVTEDTVTLILSIKKIKGNVSCSNKFNAFADNQ